MKSIVSIATYGRPNQLSNTLLSLSGQADEIRVYNNDLTNNDLKDHGKFYFLKEYHEPVYYFTCDDDIIYPPTYIKDTIEKIEEYKTIVTYHGDKYIEKSIDGYPIYDGYHFMWTLNEPRELDLAGTGVTAFRTDYFNPIDLYSHKYDAGADIVFAHRACMEDKKITIAPHFSGYFLDQKIPAKDTLWGKYFHNRPDEIVLANKILEKRNAGV